MNDTLCAILAAGSFTGTWSPAEFEDLWSRARESRVEVLLAAIVRRSREGLPAFALPRIEDRLREAQAVEMVRHRELCRIVAALHTAGVDVLLLKGAALAYTVYAQPHWRPADDIDLFIKRESLAIVERVLAGCGYERAREPDAELASFQRHYIRPGAIAAPWIDLHWRVANPRLFADAITFDAAWAGAIQVPALGPSARALGVADAVLLACLHRVAHHQDREDLLWIWDIHLLVNRMTRADGDLLARTAERTGMRAVSARGLELARDRFESRIAPELIERLRAVGPEERTARFLGGGLRQVDVLSADLQTMTSWEQRLRLVGEHLFPQPTYMRARYGAWPTALLPLAYLDRILRGAPKWFRRASAGTTSRPSP